MHHPLDPMDTINNYIWCGIFLRIKNELCILYLEKYLMDYIF